MDLRGLEAVIAVYQYGSFSSAAEALFISQPALTRRVALLERELDVRLFTRGPRGVTITDSGKALIDPARRALRETESIRGALSLVRGGRSGSLSIVGIPNLTGDLLGRMVAEFHQALPEIEIRVIAADSNVTALAMVEAGETDLAIVDLPVSSPVLNVTPVHDEEFFAVMAGGSTRSDQAAGIPTITRQMLDGRTMVHLPAKQFPKQRGMKLFSMMEMDPAGHIEVSSCELIVPIAKVGRTVAVLPRAAAMAARAEGLDLAAPPHPIRRTIGLAHHQGNHSSATKQFLRLITARAALPASPPS